MIVITPILPQSSAAHLPLPLGEVRGEGALSPLIDGRGEQASSPSVVAPSRPAPRVLHAITPSKLAGAETFLLRLLRRAQRMRASIAASFVAAGPTTSSSPLTCHSIASASAAKRTCWPSHAWSRPPAGFRPTSFTRTFQPPAGGAVGSKQLGGPPSIGHVHGFTSAHWHRRQTHLIACSARRQARPHREGHRRRSNHRPPLSARPRRHAAHAFAGPTSARELGADTDTPVVGTFAHLSPKKGHRELIQAAALVLNTIPNAHFWCFGEGPLRGRAGTNGPPTSASPTASNCSASAATWRT